MLVLENDDNVTIGTEVGICWVSASNRVHVWLRFDNWK